MSRTYWIVSGSTRETSRDSYLSSLKERLIGRGGRGSSGLALDVFPFDIPESLKVGTFDSLIKMVDSLTRHDALAEATLRRVEKSLHDVDKDAEVMIVSNRQSMSVLDYLRRFQWDEAKFPKRLGLPDIITSILTSVGKVDEELRVKTANYSELLQQSAGVSIRQGNLMQRELVDVLTPETVDDGDIIETDYLTTLFVVLPRGGDKDWLKQYESLDDLVVPRSTKQMLPEDKEGNSLWRVVLMKRSTENFKQAARQHRFVVRDFKYTATACEERSQERARLEAEIKKNRTFLRRVCEANFSDIFIAWMHLKAIRVFVESVLRFGLPPKIGAFLLLPSNKSEKKLRSELEAVLTPHGSSGKQYSQGGSQHPDSAAGVDSETQEFYPYVYLTITPTTVVSIDGSKKR